MNKLLSIVALAFAFVWSANAFGVTVRRAASLAPTTTNARPTFALRMADESESTTATTTESSDEIDPMQEEEMDAATKLQLEKQRRADELRAQEVFMKKSTGIHKCTNCDWEYDETKGDSMMIGGQIKPGTVFQDLPSNWRCPVCRASKDSFKEVVEEIPGFEVNQGYGFGGNSLTSGQKSGLIFGGLGFFFLLFLSGYAMS
jgi:rubredoxin